MCRLTAYIGPPILAADLVTRPNRSIITQSFSARERVTARGYLNGDGFGLGWYPSFTHLTGVAVGAEEPCVFTSTGPAWNNENLARLAKSISSPIVYAHVRAATAGLSVCECCCHPFHFKQYMWMHNGMIGGFRHVRRRLLSTLNDTAFAFAVSKGESDSALCFALFINELKDVWTTCPPDVLRQHLDRVISVINAAVLAEGVTEVSMLNFVVSDGRSLLATRYVFDPKNATDPVAASLYFASGTRYECKDAAECEGEYRMVHADRRDNLAIITSEPLTNDPTDWVTVPVNHSVIVTDDMHVLLTPIGSSSPAITATITSLTRHYSEVPSSRPVSRNPATRVPSETNDLDGVEAEHKLSGHLDTVLSLAAQDGYLFSGSQDGTIRVWDPREYKCIDVLRGHRGSVLALVVAKGFLFSASSDNSILKWTTRPPFECVGTLTVPHQGDILSLAAHHDFLYAGFQDTCIRRIAISKFPTGKLVRTRTSPATDLCAGCCTFTPTRGATGDALEVFAGFVGPTSRTKDSHYGYVYALLMCGSRLCSGAGDGCVMVWDIQDKACHATLKGHTGSVLALTCDADGTTLFSGSRDSSIRVWDLEGLCCKRTLQGHSSDVLSLTVAGSVLYSGGADGRVLAWSLDSLTQMFTLASGPDTVQALALSRAFALLFSGSSNNSILAWRTAASHANSPVHRLTPAADPGESDGELLDMPVPTLVDSLRVFVSFPSISGSDQHRAPCWRAAKYLARQMRLLACSEVRLLPCGDDRNPIVFGRMHVARDRPTVVVYGHYDVQPAAEEEWVSSPWQLRALDGYLYGRGATDNKGPILAFLYAAHELRNEGLLDCNLVFLFEGEEEAHSDGFREALARLSAQSVEETGLENVSMVLVSNNYWIDDSRPCLTYGTRGVVHVNVSLMGPSHDVHSGVDGGAVVEPLCELVSILASLTDSRGQILVPGFYDDVCPMTSEEEALFDRVNLNMAEYCSNLGVRAVTSTRSRDVLAARWSNPTLSIVSVDSSNTAKSFSKIPRAATAKLSIRFVPRQSATRLVELLTHHLEIEFAKRRSPNTLKVEAVHTADWWLGDPKSTIYNAASRAIEEVWGQTPMLVREGGTMPITSFLSSYLAVPALLLPMGQASDGAHLANERIRLSNLLRGKDVIKHLLVNLYGQPTQVPALSLTEHPLPVRPVGPDSMPSSPRRTSTTLTVPLTSTGHARSAPGIVVTPDDECLANPTSSSAPAASPAVAVAVPAPLTLGAVGRSHSFEHVTTSLFTPPHAGTSAPSEPSGPAPAES
eukprot:m.93046 g.93046  ORF g.93046 m.93046 type:complete len:1282 (+) comp13796_c0_seq2:297-4142(+)